MTNLLSLTLTPNLPDSWIERMFDKMLLEYGKKFTDQWGGADPDRLIQHWAEQLSGYSVDEIRRGLASLEQQEWPPSLPVFKKMCRPSVDPLMAYYEAVAGVAERAKGNIGSWSHKAIYWASVPLAFDLGTQTYSQIRGRWERALSEQMERGEWEPVPAPMLAIESPGKGALSRENAAKMLAQVGGSDILAAKVDHKLWAKRILAREKRGDKSLSALQKRFAHDAMESPPI